MEVESHSYLQGIYFVPVVFDHFIPEFWLRPVLTPSTFTQVSSSAARTMDVSQDLADYASRL